MRTYARAESELSKKLFPFSTWSALGKQIVQAKEVNWESKIEKPRYTVVWLLCVGFILWWTCSSYSSFRNCIVQWYISLQLHLQPVFPDHRCSCILLCPLIAYCLLMITFKELLKNVSIHAVLDLSKAFGTVDHQILIKKTGKIWNTTNSKGMVYLLPNQQTTFHFINVAYTTSLVAFLNVPC